MSCIVTIYGPAVIIKAAKRYFRLQFENTAMYLNWKTSRKNVAQLTARLCIEKEYQHQYRNYSHGIHNLTRWSEKTEDCFQGCYTEASNRVGDTLRVAYKIRQGTGGEVGQSQAGSGDLIIGQ